ncbi:HAD-IIB family hydrolase [Parvularcula dongshanensis]|uniref:sucrose-phosphate synthase n=1 Tax=Parvularcula dongshanensis TaxID=1173995 RepID=A0A840HYB7_9PROT|nr:HAD-IIB family hydrolase [Parvularcula dongshanensis]MBB4657846.1 sucrose-phosphate synthase [Parvularcula dongshanensis]
MFILHVALQGCLRAGPIDYGVTADTGGHIRYVLDLVRHAGARPEVMRQEIVTRAFRDGALGPDYARPRERYDAKTEIVRLRGSTDDYLEKEALWKDHDALTAAFLTYLQTLPRLPDLLHAHYADGGVIAMRAARELGLPFVFTAHSLGRVKAEACGEPRAPRRVPTGSSVLDRRIRDEEAVIGAADAIIASSRDEAELQYGLYRAADPARITVNPPGCYLDPAQIEAAPRTAWEESVARFLTDPSKPPLLALARPVRKKNLTGLVKAFGESPALRERANLVVFAGTRGDLKHQVPENRAVLEELLYLVDRYDLYGQVALPKAHDPADVPGIYAAAASLGGVFVNPALNEPFGLTLLEAAAAGLPVVATRSGGPSDIVGRCRNGVLVDPLDSADIAAGALSLLTNEARWAECVRNGLASCSYYDWPRHSADYVRLARRLTRPRPAPVVLSRQRRFLLSCDIDDTLTGDKEALAAFGRWRASDREHHFVVNTGRSLHGAIDVLRRWGAPVPDAMITSVGSEIYHLHDGDWTLSADDDWARHIGQDWDAEAVHEAVLRFAREAEPNLVPQPARDQRRFKLGYLCPDDPGIAARLRDWLRGLGHQVIVIFSHGRFLDVLPHRASKGHALDYLRAKLDVAPGHVLAAGDSGNDTEMLTMAGHPILVSNYTRELDALARVGRAYVSSYPHAAGVLDGVTAFHGRRLSGEGGLLTNRTRAAQGLVTKRRVVHGTSRGHLSGSTTDQCADDRAGARTPS